jgi:hypothetical protein
MDDLVVATFGRSIWILDDLAALRALTPAMAARDGLLPIRRTPLYVASNTFAGGANGSQGSDFFAAPNPPSGAVIQYNLRSAVRSRRELRQQSERAANRRGADIFPPSWDSLRVEDREEAPAVVVTITDASGAVVRRLAGPTAAGVQRVVWDLRYAGPTAPSAAPARGGSTDDEEEGAGPGGRGGVGPLVPPGTYRVSVAKRVDGVETALGTPQNVEVYLLDGASPRTPAVLAFQRQVADLQRAISGATSLVAELNTRTQALERAEQETPGASAQLGADVRAIRARLRTIQEALNGDPTLSRRQEPTPPSLLGRAQVLNQGNRALGAPTATQRRQYEIVSGEFTKVLADLRGIADTDLRRVESAAEAAGVPWTPGRVPGWKPQP